MGVPSSVDVVVAYTQTDTIAKTQTAAVGQTRMGADVQTQPAANTWVEVDTYPALVPDRVPAQFWYYRLLLLSVLELGDNIGGDTRDTRLYF